MKDWEALGEPDHMNLTAACMIVEAALQDTPYLVGSAAISREFRDVDVRVILDDEKFETLFGDGVSLDPFWMLFCIAVSSYLKQQTGLPVDFQVQKRSRVKEEDLKKPRHPLSMGVTMMHPKWAESEKRLKVED